MAGCARASGRSGAARSGSRSTRRRSSTGPRSRSRAQTRRERASRTCAGRSATRGRRSTSSRSGSSSACDEPWFVRPPGAASERRRSRPKLEVVRGRRRRTRLPSSRLAERARLRRRGRDRRDVVPPADDPRRRADADADRRVGGTAVAAAMSFRGDDGGRHLRRHHASHRRVATRLRVGADTRADRSGAADGPQPEPRGRVRSTAGSASSASASCASGRHAASRRSAERIPRTAWPIRCSFSTSAKRTKPSPPGPKPDAGADRDLRLARQLERERERAERRGRRSGIARPDEHRPARLRHVPADARQPVAERVAPAAVDLADLAPGTRAPRSSRRSRRSGSAGTSRSRGSDFSRASARDDRRRSRRTKPTRQPAIENAFVSV